MRLATTVVGARVSVSSAAKGDNPANVDERTNKMALRGSARVVDDMCVFKDVASVFRGRINHFSRLAIWLDRMNVSFNLTVAGPLRNRHNVLSPDSPSISCPSDGLPREDPGSPEVGAVQRILDAVQQGIAESLPRRPKSDLIAHAKALSVIHLAGWESRARC